MLIRGNRGLLRALPVAVPVWIGTISEGFYFLHSRPEHQRPGLAPCRESRRTALLRCFCRS
jgi:hypothetical protein